MPLDDEKAFFSKRILQSFVFTIQRCVGGS